jgi:hypothetical protein
MTNITKKGLAHLGRTGEKGSSFQKILFLTVIILNVFLLLKLLPRICNQYAAGPS